MHLAEARDGPFSPGSVCLLSFCEEVVIRVGVDDSSVCESLDIILGNEICTR